MPVCANLESFEGRVGVGGTSANLPNALYLGSQIDGTLDEIVLCVRPLSSNATIQGSLTWRELS